MRHNLLEALMGAIVLVIAAIFLAFAYTSSETRVSKGYMLKAYFEKIDGLNMGSDVKLNGVKVGNVTKVEVVPQSYQIAVAFSVKSDIKIPEDSSAEIVSEGFLGGKYVSLVPGGSSEYLSEGDSLAHTQSSVNFERLLSKFVMADKKDEK